MHFKNPSIHIWMIYISLFDLIFMDPSSASGITELRKQATDKQQKTISSAAAVDLRSIIKEHARVTIVMNEEPTNHITEVESPAFERGTNLGSTAEIVDSNSTGILKETSIKNDVSERTVATEQHLFSVTTTTTAQGWPSSQEIDEQQNLICSLGCDCLPGKQVETFLDCSGKKIRELPRGVMLPSTLTGISFQMNSLTNISTYTFIDAPALESLNLADNKIQVIEENAFQCFTSLNELRLSNNRLRNLLPRVLEGLEDLRVLEIGHNEISKVPNTFFVPVRNLQELRIQHNKLEVLDDRIFGFLPNLEKLDLAGNGLKSLPTDLFRSTPQLISLSLSDNAFEYVPRTTLSTLKKLNTLDLSGNRFKVLGKGAFSSMDNVTALHLNNIQTLERIEEFAFVNMTNLKFLYCSYNRRLQYIHPNAFGCPNQHPSYRTPPIVQLHLRQNALKRLPKPDFVNTWSRLSYADLRDNPWICDCHLRWMKSVPQEVFSTVRCEKPLNMHGRLFASIEEADLECNDAWMLSTIIIGLTSVLVFVVCIGFVVSMIYSRSSIRRYLMSRSQFMYSKVPPKTEVVDLEWDPSADI